VATLNAMKDAFKNLNANKDQQKELALAIYNYETKILNYTNAWKDSI
jgi:hypothetical protein